jgi:hypothetical protein
MQLLSLQSFSWFFLLLLNFASVSNGYTLLPRLLQKVLGDTLERAHNKPWYPDPSNPVPYKKPLAIDEHVNWFKQLHNGSEDGYYRRSSCPAINMLANRGFINRSGRNITYTDLYRAVRDVYNFGEDNAS